MKSCVFCDILEGNRSGCLVVETGNVAVFQSLENHPLIVPRRHIPDIYGLDDELGAEIMKMAIRVAKAVKRAMGCDGIHVTQANEAAAGQDVFHYHMHIWPKWADGKQLDASLDSRSHAAEAIRKQLTL